MKLKQHFTLGFHLAVISKVKCDMKSRAKVVSTPQQELWVGGVGLCANPDTSTGWDLSSNSRKLLFVI